MNFSLIVPGLDSVDALVDELFFDDRLVFAVDDAAWLVLVPGDGNCGASDWAACVPDGRTMFGDATTGRGGLGDLRAVGLQRQGDDISEVSEPQYHEKHTLISGQEQTRRDHSVV